MIRRQPYEVGWLKGPVFGGLALTQPTVCFDLGSSQACSEARHLLKPHPALGGGCSCHLKLTAKLARQSLNEP
jgi:hypothetical protein